MKLIRKKLNCHHVNHKSGFVWGGMDAPLRDSTPCRTRGSPLCTILRYAFLVTDPKNVRKLLTPIYILVFRGERAPKKRDFWSKFRQNAVFGQNAFFGLFFKNLPATQKIWSNQGLDSDLEDQKSN